MHTVNNLDQLLLHTYTKQLETIRPFVAFIQQSVHNNYNNNNKEIFNYTESLQSNSRNQVAKCAGIVVFYLIQRDFIFLPIHVLHWCFNKFVVTCVRGFCISLGAVASLKKKSIMQRSFFGLYWLFSNLSQK
jgi:hypothetical protein